MQALYSIYLYCKVYSVKVWIMENHGIVIFWPGNSWNLIMMEVYEPWHWTYFLWYFMNFFIFQFFHVILKYLNKVTIILLYTRLKNGTYYVIALYWQPSRRAYARWFLLNISRNILLIFTKFGTQKHQDETKIEFEPGDLDLHFEVTEVIQGNSMWKMVSTHDLNKYVMYSH